MYHTQSRVAKATYGVDGWATGFPARIAAAHPKNQIDDDEVEQGIAPDLTPLLRGEGRGVLLDLPGAELSVQAISQKRPRNHKQRQIACVSCALAVVSGVHRSGHQRDSEVPAPGEETCHKST